MNFFFSFLQWLHNDDSIIDCDTTKFLSEKFTEVKMLARCYLYSDTGFLVVASFERLFLSWWKVLLQLPWFYSEHRTSADIQGSNVKSLWAFHTAIHPRARASLFACFYYVPVFFCWIKCFVVIWSEKRWYWQDSEWYVHCKNKEVKPSIAFPRCALSWRFFQDTESVPWQQTRGRNALLCLVYMFIYN